MNVSWHSAYPGFINFLDDKNRMTLNAGIVGGRRAALEPALLQIRERLLSNLRTRRPPMMYWGEDMVAWNELAFNRPLLTGYPFGPVNLPMYGTRTHADKKDGNMSEWHQRHRRHFWFTHKFQNGLRYWHYHPSCRDHCKDYAACPERHARPNCTLPLCFLPAEEEFEWRRVTYQTDSKNQLFAIR